MPKASGRPVRRFKTSSKTSALASTAPARALDFKRNVGREICHKPARGGVLDLGIMRVRPPPATEAAPSHAAAPDSAIGFDEVFTLHHRAFLATARSVLRDEALEEEI